MQRVALTELLMVLWMLISTINLLLNNRRLATNLKGLRVAVHHLLLQNLPAYGLGEKAYRMALRCIA